MEQKFKTISPVNLFKLGLTDTSLNGLEIVDWKYNQESKLATFSLRVKDSKIID